MKANKSICYKCKHYKYEQHYINSIQGFWSAGCCTLEPTSPIPLRSIDRGIHQDCPYILEHTVSESQ